MKVSVSIPDAVFRAAAAVARRMGISRSRLYTIALERLVQKHDDDAITAKIDEVCDQESTSLDPVLQSIQFRSIAKPDKSQKPLLENVSYWYDGGEQSSAIPANPDFDGRQKE